MNIWLIILIIIAFLDFIAIVILVASSYLDKGDILKYTFLTIFIPIIGAVVTIFTFGFNGDGSTSNFGGGDYVGGYDGGDSCDGGGDC